MNPPFVHGLAAGMMLALGAVSLVIWFAVFRVRKRDGTVLGFRPRRPVPWGPLGFIVVVYFVLQQLSSHFAAGGGETPSMEAFARGVLYFGLFELVGTAVGVLLVVKVSGATWVDLGLPDSIGDALADMALGVVAALSALLPMYVLLTILVNTFGEVSHNPLLERLSTEPAPTLLAIISFSAILAAPVFEEFMFRLLAQGWLQRMLIPRNAALYRLPTVDQPAAGETEMHLPPKTADEGTFESAAAAVVSDGELATAEPVPLHAPDRVYWSPILVISALFALAHAGRGYGYSAAPLFLLAIILGYIYQRTHRILPCIAAHMLFNGINILMLSLDLFGGE